MSDMINPHDPRFDELLEIYEGLSDVKKKILEWLLENLPLIDRLAAASTLSKEEVSALLNEMPEKMDYRLKILLLYRLFKLEQDSPSRPPC